MDRRGFLIAASSSVIAAAMPPMPALAADPIIVGLDLAKGPDVTSIAFAVGTPGEFDWQHIIASSAEEAWRLWVEERGGFDDHKEFGEELPVFDPDMVLRVERWDGKAFTTGADWFDAGMGYCCERCGDETSRDDGRAVGSEVICTYCLTWEDRLVTGDHDEIVDEIANRLQDAAEQDVREWLAAERLLPMVDDLGLWSKGTKAALE